MNYKVWLANSNEKAMDLLLNVFALILCKKVPSEIGVGKIENLHNKVKLISPIAAMKEPLKTDAAVVRLMHQPRSKEPPLSPTSVNTTDNDSVVLAMNGRTPNLPYTVLVINQNASRVWREDFMVAMSKVIPEFFKEDSKHGRNIIVRSDHLCQEREESFLA